MENCYTGTNVPETQCEPCHGKYTSTDCIIDPNALVYLNLPANSTVSEIFTALILALMYKDEQIGNLQTQLNTLL